MAQDATGAAATNFTRGIGLHTKPVPLEPYRSASFFAAERDRVFARAWLMLARVEELPAPGDYVVKSIPTNGVSVILSHAKDGRIRGFYNSCSHRGSEVVAGPRGNAARFTCPYHSWTYANDGRLVGIPDEPSFFAVDKANCGLTPIATETWEGWIFVNLQRRPEVSLAMFLGPFAVHLAGLKYQAASTPVVLTADLDAFTATFHRPSGTTHLLATPAPEILAALADGPLDLEGLLARLSADYDMADADRAALAARLDELCGAGLIEAA